VSYFGILISEFWRAERNISHAAQKIGDCLLQQNDKSRSSAKSREKKTNEIKDIVDFSARLLLVTNTFLSGGKNKTTQRQRAQNSNLGQTLFKYSERRRSTE